MEKSLGQVLQSENSKLFIWFDGYDSAGLAIAADLEDAKRKVFDRFGLRPNGFEEVEASEFEGGVLQIM